MVLLPRGLISEPLLYCSNIMNTINQMEYNVIQWFLVVNIL